MTALLFQDVCGDSLPAQQNERQRGRATVFEVSMLPWRLSNPGRSMFRWQRLSGGWRTRSWCDLRLRLWPPEAHGGFERGRVTKMFGYPTSTHLRIPGGGKTLRDGSPSRRQGSISDSCVWDHADGWLASGDSALSQPHTVGPPRCVLTEALCRLPVYLPSCACHASGPFPHRLLIYPPRPPLNDFPGWHAPIECIADVPP